MSERRLEDLLRELLDRILGEGEVREVELRDVSIEADELELELRTVAQALPREVWERLVRPRAEAVEREVEVPEYEPPVEEYEGEVAEVQLGATRSEGGTRDRVVKLGGERAYFVFESPRPNPPVVTF
ncbi:MAG: CO dehydrogenase/acetyl-CoA synthase subunit delta, partial [Methanopyraceae archaeon]